MASNDQPAACTGFGDCGCDVCCPEPGSGCGVGHDGRPLGRSGDTEPRPGTSAATITHGRHCTCSACARQDWSEPQLACCGMHGPSCPPVYAPLGAPGQPDPSAALSLGGGAYMSRATYCPRCGLRRVAAGPFGDCTRCAAPGFISDEHEASEKRKAWKR